MYAFLRERLDARWYWPGESGEFLPKLSRFEVKAWEKKWRPFFNLREMSICSIWRHRHADTEHWFPKVFLNCGIQTPEIREEINYVRRTSGHVVSLPVTMPERQKMFDELVTIVEGFQDEELKKLTKANSFLTIPKKKRIPSNMQNLQKMSRC